MMEHVNGLKAAAASVFAALTALWGWFGWLVVVWVGCMVIDYVTGSAAACKAGAWSSRAAREGLWHKLGAIVAVLISGILDLVVGLLLKSVPALRLPFPYTVFLVVLVVAWYIMTEIGSIIENAGKLGAPMPGWLRKAVAALKSGIDKAGEDLSGQE